MIKRSIILCIAILSLTAVAAAARPETINVQLGQHKKADRGRVTIVFLSVEEDSRCPAGTTCIWAGNAKIKVAVSKGKARAQTVELNTGLEPKTATAYGYELSLVDLTPRPGDKQGAADLPRSVKISVKKL